ncbi:protein ecdysoneless homolog isoform X3 [Tyto alba]|nr:protein ecdysoneless homolog isoform X3 [Tyto alba]XP_042650014.1 protein ecdysoneless homolog isoform X3 [Tyto alba]XP_042650015.1 protein ecdysoneless homolog isoform X3 [Tyto alba]XP_042650016.1 protein ecdysoneless homolog isoform X3 [Tyto alba]
MEGSAKYLEVLHRAEDYFQQSVTKPESSFEVSPGDEILTLLQTTTVDLKEFEREAACLFPEDGADSEELDSDGLDEEEEFDFSNKDDEDLDVEDQRQDQKVPPNELIGSLKSYMSEMDRELAHTNVGKSFTVQKRGASSVNATTSQSAGPDSGAEDTELTEIKKAQTIGLKPKLTSE